MAGSRYPEHFGDPRDVLVDTGKSAGLERDNRDLAAAPGCHRGFDLLEAHGADLALALGDDNVGRQAPESVFQHLVNGNGVLHGVPDTGVDGGAGTAEVYPWPGANGQAFDAGRIVAFVGTADQSAGATEAGDDFSCARQQRDDSFSGCHDR